MQLGFQLTHDKALAGFFDRKAVMSAVDKAHLYVSRTAGYRVRQTARKSLKIRPYGQQKVAARMFASGRTVYGAAAEGAIRNGTGERILIGDASPPGSPPYAREKEGLRRIYYAWDAVSRSTIIGPVLYKPKVAGKTIPEIHEYGATITVAGQLRKYPRRPFMQPALEKHIPDLPGLWKDAIKRG